MNKIIRDIVVMGKKPTTIPWYLTGAVPSANCLAAYKPKGAADYAASKVNLTGNATYDAVDGAAYPTWDGTNGWKFLVTSSQYLDPGIVPKANMSFIVRCSNLETTVERALIGYYKSGTMRVQLGPNTPNMAYGNGGLLNKTPLATSGVFGVAGQDGYRNGASESLSIAAWSGVASTSVLIGGRRREDTTSIDTYLTGYIQAFSVYDIVLTPAQVLAISTAMAAL